MPWLPAALFYVCVIVQRKRWVQPKSLTQSKAIQKKRVILKTVLLGLRSLHKGMIKRKQLLSLFCFSNILLDAIKKTNVSGLFLSATCFFFFSSLRFHHVYLGVVVLAGCSLVATANSQGPVRVMGCSNPQQTLVKDSTVPNQSGMAGVF